MVNVVRSLTGACKRDARASGFQTSQWGSLSTVCQIGPESHVSVYFVMFQNIQQANVACLPNLLVLNKSEL